MAKRGYKLQEFVAHTGSVNCLSIGKKTCRLFITGGDDQRVNLWSIGKSTSLMSLCGHVSPVESLAFDSSEILVAAGASAGAIKLWDLEETKMVRTLTGHRSNCTAVEFHPFGEFFASGSMDTNLKVWDIRKKGCIHTYKGHTKGISNIRFSPDGRWVVSGGFDNVVKVWDLTAGKLLHDFKFHVGHVQTIDFHPLEFLMATGSADKTVKFWDLETFELIGSSRPEATGVRSITFHPDGRTLFCGFDDCLKVYSWEPIICHDALDMGWSTLRDLVICDGKLLGCSHYRNSVGVWVADISLIEPYGAGLVPEQNISLELKCDLRESPLEKIRTHRRSSSSLSSISLDNESKDIKNIYVDSVNLTTSKKVGSLNSSKVVPPSTSKDCSYLATQKPVVVSNAKSIRQADAKSFTMPAIVPRDSPDGKGPPSSRRESIMGAKSGSAMSLKPPHIRILSAGNLDMERMSIPVEVASVQKTKSDSSTITDAKDLSFHTRLAVNVDAVDSSEEKHWNINSVSQKFEKVLSPVTPSSQKNCGESFDCNKGMDSVKFVNGVAVVRGRTRSLVERFERREKLNGDEVQTPDSASNLTSEPAKVPSTLNSPSQISGTASTVTSDDIIIEYATQNHDVVLSALNSRLTKLQVVHHFWEQNDINGALKEIKKFPDHSVQTDVVSVFMEKMQILNLDMFSCLLPVLLGLLDSKIERHVNISLEMLLKLVAVFGPVIHSTISAPRAVGVDLHAEQRRECCNECLIQLQKIKVLLPALVRRGGVLAKCAQELNLVLQESRPWHFC